MPGPVAGPLDDNVTGPGFAVANQRVFLDLDLRSRRLKGRAEITINPLSPDLKSLRLSCRQLAIGPVQIERKTCKTSYEEPYERIKLPYQGNVHHHPKLKERLASQARVPPERELEIALPTRYKIKTVTSNETPALLSSGVNGVGAVTAENVPQFEPFVLTINFEASKIKDGLQFVGWNSQDLRYPHVYTWSSPHSSVAALFPCFESVDFKCTWEISIRTPRTLADAFSKPNGSSRDAATSKGLPGLTNEDCALDLNVICSGDMTDEIIDPTDPTRKTTSFLCSTPVSALHIGFAIGPFEEVNLAAFRGSDEDDKLGRNAVPVHGFCLPGRASELKNTCFPIAKAMDYFVVEFGSYPFPSFKLCFVDDMHSEHYDTASLSICSNKMLFPDDIIDPMENLTRELVHGLARQWSGISITPKEPADLWSVLGMSYFITDLFLRKLMGNNEYRFQRKRRVQQVCSMDVDQPPIYDCGRLAWLDPSLYDLVAAKAPLVLFILDRRLAKAGGSTGFSRIVSKIFLQANVGEIVDGALTSAHFMRICERLGHTKLDVFFTQWVHGCGCPRFRVTQRFNKKRLVIELQISQVHNEDDLEDLKASRFMRAVKEREHGESVASQVQTFTGPMTIRIHEADGTPYEHIVEIKEAVARFDIPYNTKYKRLKRNRRQRDRAFLGGGHDVQVDTQDDVLLYSLGDVLQSEEEMREWRLAEWSKEDEEKMNGESYEWIRVDADFEWICEMHINMPGYMFLSQLQQDRDVAAQWESIRYFTTHKPHVLVSSILLRTLIDDRYYHGIRTMAANTLSRHAAEETSWLGWWHLEKAFQHLFCLEGSIMTRSNEFSNRASYFVQCAIPRAAAAIRDNKGRSPLPVRKFLYEKLRFNDNSNNEFSDCFYLATLMKGLAEAMASAPLLDNDDDINMDDDGDDYPFFKACLDEIDRYRRLDEWIPSHQNTLSVTALSCMVKLAKAGSIPRNPTEYLLLTREGTFEDVRVAAFECLIALGFWKHNSILRWLLHVLGHDTSPFVRLNLQRLFGTLLGSIAIGEEPSSTVADGIQEHSSDVVIEQESTTNTRQAALARKQTVSGATAALKSAIGNNETLKAALWDAIYSPIISLPEIMELLIMCALLYDAEQAMLIRLRLPRYWTVASIDRSAASAPDPKITVGFKKDGRVRQKPLPRPRPRPEPNAQAPEASQPSAKAPAAAPKRVRMGEAGAEGSRPIIRLKINSDKKSGAGPGPGPAVVSAQTGGATAAADEERPKLKLKFKAPKPPS